MKFIIIFGLFLILLVGQNYLTQSDALRQYSGDLEISIIPGKSATNQFGLISDDEDKTITVHMTVEGPAAEFLSFPDSMDIEPLGRILYLITATIPENYDGETIIEGILYATEFGETGGQIIVNVAMEKKIILTVLTPVSAESAETPKTTEEGGGCLIATAAFGSEFAPQVQMLREIRDNTVLSTTSGTTFMTGFNQFYYSFSPTIADWERENPVFKETVKLAITPLLTSLSILNYVDINSEEEMLGYGISLILLNIGMYFVAPAFVILRIKRNL